jgi:hypothetical protein
MAPRPKLPIPAKAMMNNGLILGKPGAGKSALARFLFETEVDDGHRAIFVDPMGDAAGIRLTAAGKPSRFKHVAIIGGPHADIPITADDGAKTGKFVAMSRSSFLVDISDFIQAEQLRFMGQFAEHLYENMAVPAVLFLDEAHLFAPQDRGEASSFLINRMTRLNSQGRKRGIYLWLMTQRPARINKNIIAGTETLVAMKMTTPRDIGAMEEWLSAHDPDQAKQAKTAVAKLAVGEAIVWSPGLDFFGQVQFPFHSTFDSGRTPEHGETVGKIDIPKVTDLAAIAAAFGVITAADPRDDEIAKLREALRIAEFNRKEALAGWREEKTLATGVIDILTDIQLRIGAVIGSLAINPLPPGAAFDDFVFVEQDGIVKPFLRDDNAPLVAVARKSIGRARLPAKMAPKASTRKRSK